MDNNKQETISQAKFIHDFEDKYRPHFNEELFKRDDQSIIDEVSKVIYSCQKDKYFTLRVLSIDIITDYEDIYDTLRQHYERKKRKNIKEENPYDYIQIRDSSIILLKVKYFIQKNGTERLKVDGVDKDVENPNTILDVLIELPKFVHKYYFRLQGNYYIPVNQIVDGSTYNNSTTSTSKHDNVTQKTLFMSVRIYRILRDIVDINTNEKIHTILYTSVIFKNHVNTMLYLLAKYGLYACYELFHINYIKITNTPINDTAYYCFKKHNIYVSVPIEIFQEPIVQSMIMTILDGIFKDTTISQLYTWSYWLIVLGYCFKNANVDKGLFVLDSLESIYDINTLEKLHLPMEAKKNIYVLLKWLITNFSKLRAKDNVDVSIKRVRIAEYIAHTYAMKLTRGIHRISDLGKRVKLKQIIAAIYTNPKYIISKIILMSNLISYSDLVNDNDATQVLRCTYKGISGLGEDGGSVQSIYQLVDASHLGIIDLDTSPTSDPGMSGMLCPMVNIKENGYFTDYKEPNKWDINYIKKMKKYYNDHNKIDPIIQENGQYEFDYDYIKKEMEDRFLNMQGKNCPIVDLNGIIDYRYPINKQPQMIDLTGTKKVIDDTSIFIKKEDNINTNEVVEDNNIEDTYIYTPYIIQDNEGGN